MNKKIIGLIVLIIIVCAVAVGAYLLMPNHKTFHDGKIQVEIPNDVNFTVNKSNEEYIENILYFTDHSDFDGKDLSIFDIISGIFNPKSEIILPFTGINIISINSNASYSEEIYKTVKNDYIKYELENSTKIDGSKYNHNGTIYNMTDQTGMHAGYGIILFDDSNMKIITLLSTDLDTVIHMAKTFKLK